MSDYKPISYRYERPPPRLSDLVGKTLTAVRQYAEDPSRIDFVVSESESFALYHSQDCCEHVDLDDVCGNLDDLVGSPITLAEEVSCESGDEDNPDSPPRREQYDESWTWTLYRIGTAKGVVTLRFYGQSNGYYSESVDFARVTPAAEDKSYD